MRADRENNYHEKHFLFTFILKFIEALNKDLYFNSPKA